jgi:serine/threonine protein kinase
MNKNQSCPKCGQPVPPDAPEGLCPRCVGALNLDSESGVTGASSATATPPPSALELAPHFPQLEILELLGRGGMGVVYKVRQKELDRVAALKILPPGIGADPAFAERFAREAKALARLNHPGIVTIYDSGRTDGLFYFLMEFVDGVSLGRLMHGGRVSSREALAIVPQICDALQYAHDQGIVHRDIKPENILLDRQGRVKVADFGLAKLLAGRPSVPASPDFAGDRPISGLAGTLALPKRPTGALTDAGKIMGTPAYMAPEQAEHPAAVDHRADIYALGVVFYQMLTGELPGQRLDPPSRKVQVDVRLDEVVLRALEKEPERRYQQVSEVKTAVETIAGSAAPERQPAPARSEAWEAASRRVRPFATALLVLGAFQFVLSMLVTVRGFGPDSLHLSLGLFGYWRLPLPEPWASALAVLAPYLRALNLLVVLGAFRMRRLESYGLAVAAAVAAVITPTLLPLGAWALTILTRKDVRREFGRFIPTSGSDSPGTVPRLSKLAVASLILTLASILTSSFAAALGLFEPVLPRSTSAGLFGLLVSSAFIWVQAWPVLGTVLLAAVALEDIRCGWQELKGAGIAIFGLLCVPLEWLVSAVPLLLFLPFGGVGGAVGHHAADSSHAPPQWAGFSLLSIVFAMVLSAGAAFWVQAHEARRWRGGPTGAAATWWLLSKPVVRCLQVLAVALLLSNACLRGHFAQIFGERRTATASRAEASIHASLPTVEQILARYAKAKGEMAGAEKARTLDIKGTFTSRDGLPQMDARALIEAPDKWLLALKKGGAPLWRRGFNGSVGWEVSPWGPPQVDPPVLLMARVLTGVYRGDALAMLLPNASLKGLEPIGNGKAFVVETTLPGKPLRLWFDEQTGLLVRIEYTIDRNVMQMDCDDYRDVGGLMVPFKLRQTGSENWTIECSAVKLNEPVDDDAFARPSR